MSNKDEVLTSVIKDMLENPMEMTDEEQEEFLTQGARRQLWGCANQALYAQRIKLLSLGSYTNEHVDAPLSELLGLIDDWYKKHSA